MGFIVPNAEDALSFFTALDQAEPDSLDFEILGNASRSYVVSGGAVTTASSTAVSVGASVVVINGVLYVVGASASTPLPSAPTDLRFDLVALRASGGSATIVVIQGANSTSNPKYPQSRTVIGSFSAGVNYDPDTDVILAAVYRVGSSSITSHNIIDKRCFGSLIIPAQEAATPTPGTATKGALYYKNNAAPTGSGSNVFVGGPDGNWTELSANPTSTGPYVPIGGMIGWPSNGSVPVGFLEANGQSVSTITYARLFVEYGYTHGGTGGNFNVPSFNEKVPKGTSVTSGVVGTTVGSDSITLTSGQLPIHKHTLTDPGHGHTQQSHNHLQDAHAHALPHGPPFTQAVAAAGSITADASNSGNTAVSTATNQSATAVNNGNTTGITMANTGNGDTVSVVQSSMYTRWIIRAL